ncbi:hypothetical protein [Maribacter sp. MAR_2009_72]|uniref:hypothetical protein n=1 Tax=Maribacter sp. MAR_2009_72 TaxID=1250050 RepID=UPI00119ABAF0|nr:hypothetical protein [Maribacter sp. MAR_2009_72]TVZ16485.1 hypothetical protein JM81_2746 [Maribacter sp. MAR_2009_72]
MKKNIPIIFLLFVCCNSESFKKQSGSLKTNFYDLYYLEIANRKSNFYHSNIDSLVLIKNTDKMFSKMIHLGLIDSASVLKIKESKSIKENAQYNIEVTDTVKLLIKKLAGNFEVFDYLSKPIEISGNKRLLFFENQHKLGYSNGVVFFTKEKEGWRLDSIKVLDNYRGGSTSW